MIHQNNYSYLPEQKVPNSVKSGDSADGRPVIMGQPINPQQHQQIQNQFSIAEPYNNTSDDALQQSYQVVNSENLHQSVQGFQDKTQENTPYGNSQDPKYSYQDHHQKQNSASSPSNMVQPSGQLIANDVQMFGEALNPTQIFKIVSRQSQMAMCHHCYKYVQTVVEYKVGSGALISGSVLFCLGAIPCCLIPCMLKECKDAVHSCPTCRKVLGTVKFITN